MVARSIRLFAGLVAACATPALAQTTRPLVISPETTIVTGPLNPDGTVNYVAAINDLLSKGISNENNAAPLLLQASVTKGNRDAYARMAKFLAIQLPTENSLLQRPDDFVVSHTASNTKPDLDAIATRVQKYAFTPWQPADFPELAECLHSEEPSLTVLEKACEFPHCFLPLVSKSTPPQWIDAMPPLATFHLATRNFALRAMLRAGTADFDGALQDLHRIQTVAHFAQEQKSSLSFLIALAVDAYAQRDCQALILSGLQAPQLNTLRRQIESAPALTVPDDCDKIEEMFALDEVMSCARGEFQGVLNMHAGTSESPVKYDLGDLPRLDCNTLLTVVRGEHAEWVRMSRLPLNQQLAIYDQLIPAAKTDKMPVNAILSSNDTNSGRDVLEAYLKMRPGETAPQFAKRVAHWWSAGDLNLDRSFVPAITRGQLERDLTLLTLSLAEYHQTHAAYPDSLAALGIPVLQDPFSSKDIVYRRQGSGYILYSVGINQKDDHGTGDDRPIIADK